MQARQVVELGKKLKIPDSNKLIQMWPKFYNDITSLPMFCENKDAIRKHTEVFWANVLNSNKIDIPPPIKSLIQTILIIPLGKILISTFF